VSLRTGLVLCQCWALLDCPPSPAQGERLLHAALAGLGGLRGDRQTDRGLSTKAPALAPLRALALRARDILALFHPPPPVCLSVPPPLARPPGPRALASR